MFLRNALKTSLSYSRLINAIKPGTVKKINTMKAPFKQRENIEMYLKGCEALGLKSQDLFQVNDLYENKNLYMVVDNICTVGGMVRISFHFLLILHLKPVHFCFVLFHCS